MIFDISFFGRCTTLSIIVCAYLDLIEAISSLVGTPVTSRTFSSWFMVDEPGRRGLPTNISASMQPTAHLRSAKGERVRARGPRLGAIPMACVAGN